MSDKLGREFSHFRENQDEFVEKYNDKVIVLKDLQVIGVYDSEQEALQQTKKGHAIGTFLIQRVGAGVHVYSATIYTHWVR